MTPAARIAAASEVLDHILDGTPAEKALTGWARRSRFAGSGDRAALRDLVFDALRRKRSLAAMGGAMTGRGLMLGLLRAEGQAVETVFTGQGHAPEPPSDAENAAGRQPAPGAEACDIPDWLWPDMQASLGARTEEIAAVLQARAPVMLRVNLRRTTRDAAQERLAQEGVESLPDTISPTALRVVSGGRRVAQTDSYLTGLVELQDGASQATIDELRLPSIGNILDYCAGGGGKALAMADRTEATFFAHDIQPNRMKDLPARAERAGVQIVTATTEDLPAIAPFDLVLCDAPCSGSGAWRRTPEGKWALTRERLDELTAIQDTILTQAAALVAPQGTLAFATCSILRAENEDRIEAFLANHPAWQKITAHRWWPGPSGDGFFLAQLQRK
ncbi:MAG: RsmB/NOP family class I SAM-dependent RNA methyltransferase [Rhodobacterales bacterium]